MNNHWKHRPHSSQTSLNPYRTMGYKILSIGLVPGVNLGVNLGFVAAKIWYEVRLRVWVKVRSIVLTSVSQIQY